MSHSLYSYLRRRTTEELENVLVLYMADRNSALSREVLRLTISVLSERGVNLPAECLEWLKEDLENR